MKYLFTVLLCLMTAGCGGGSGEKPRVGFMPPVDMPRPTLTRIGTLSASESGMRLNEWGYWGRDAQGETLFAVALGGYVQAPGREQVESIAACAEGSVFCLDYYINGTAIDGRYSSSNPVSGSAIWLGEARAVQDGMAYEGQSQVRVNFSNSTVDVDITDVGRDLAWHQLSMIGGEFGTYNYTNHVSGHFFGPDHEGAAGRFWVLDDGYIVGIFGALRQ